MLLSTPNGCLCHTLRDPAYNGLCISCRGRKKAAEKGHTCRKCGVGLFPGDETERTTCSNCEYG